jgi:hypothetical protein
VRTIRDALLSVQKYVDVIFNGDPPLYEIRWTGLRWTGPRWQRKDALLVSAEQWNALRYQAGQEVVELSELGQEVLVRVLYVDPRPAILALGLPALPVNGGLTVLDSFNRANASPVDGSWVAGFHGAGLPDLVGNAVQPNVSNVDDAMRWSGASLPTDCVLAVKLGLWSGLVDGTEGGDVSVFLESDGLGTNEVSLQVDTTGFVLLRSNDGSGAPLGNFENDTYPPFATGDIVGIKTSGLTATAFRLRAGVETDIATIACMGPVSRMAEVAVGQWAAGPSVSQTRASVDEVYGGALVPLVGGSFVPVASSTPRGELWEVRFAQERGEFIQGGPVALVYLVGQPTNTGSAKYAEWTQAMAVHCYPPPQSTIDLSTLSALDVETKLQNAFRMSGVGLGRPLRVPLFDYADVADPIGEDSDVRFPSDFLSITSFDTDRLPDAQDPRRIRVVANFQARWRSTGPVEIGRITESVDPGVVGVG